jgi:hypothetical protein
MSSEPPSPASDAPPATNTRFSLRSLLVLTAIVAIVVALCRHSLLATLSVGVPIVLYTIFSYLLHRHRWSGWACLAISIAASSLGLLVYSLYEQDQYFSYRSLLGLAASILSNPCAFTMGLFLGFIPLILEYWLRLIADGVIASARWIRNLWTRRQ